MEIIKFDCHGHNAPAYSCNKPGDNSGEYVRADYAKAKIDAMLTVLEEVDECAAYWSEYDVPLGLHERIKAAIAKARGENV